MSVANKIFVQRLTAKSFMADLKYASSTHGNSYSKIKLNYGRKGTLTSTPLSIRKHLNPRTPAFTNFLR